MAFWSSGGDWVPREGERKNFNKKRFQIPGNLRSWNKKIVYISPVKLEIKPKGPSHSPHKHMNNFYFIYLFIYLMNLNNFYLVFARRRICMWTIQWLITSAAISYVRPCRPQSTSLIFPFRVVLYLGPWSFIWE